MSISAAQIRAGRGLMNWTAKDLAERIGITSSSLSAIENGQSKGSLQTLASAEACLVAAGIEFLAGDGVRKRQTTIMELEGTEGFRSLMDMVYTAAQKDKAEICLFNGSPDLFIQWLGQEWYTHHAERMAKLENDVSLKILIRAGDNNFIARGFAEYRWIPEELFQKKTIYVFDKYVAFISFDPEQLKIRVIEDQDMANAMHALFTITWKHVSEIPAGRIRHA